MNVYVSIGNSDDKLTQAEWAEFIEETRDLLLSEAKACHGEWYSLPTAPWQNANWVIEVGGSQVVNRLRKRLYAHAVRFRQDSIALTVGLTRFIGPGGESA